MLLNACMVQKNMDIKALAELVADNPTPRPVFDTLILDIAKNRDKAAFVTLFEHFAPRVKSYLIKGGTREDTADELAQETMLAVWDKASAFNPAKASAATWIYTIARNKKIDLLRKGVRYDLDINELEQADPAAPASEKLIAEDETAGIAAALEKLPAEQAHLIRQSFFEGKSHSEIAKENNLPLGTVKSRMRLALERLRKEENVQELWQ